MERAILRRQKIKAELELEGLKREFQALLTHDLRNPAACASVALKMYKENPREEVLETAMESLDRFFSRLDRYQVFSSLDGGLLELEMERGSLRELICAVVEELLPLAEEKRQTVLWAPPDLDCDCAFDRTWLYHALENLIENAIKYSGFEGRIEVRLAVTEQKATVVVSDNGPGIQPEFQPLLFRRFYRAEKTRTTEGIGLGLLIVKRVVEAHGGTVEVHSEGVAGEGASFSMFLPLGRD